MLKRHATSSIVILMFLTLALTACGKDKAPTASSAADQPSATSIPAPVAGGAAESPLLSAGDSPVATPVSESPIVTPEREVSGMTGETSGEAGAITGKILISRDGADVPVAGMIIGLAEVIRDENGNPQATGYAPDTAKKGTTHDDGGFAVNLVPPGMYSLILDAVITSYQLENPVTGETILVEVESGEVVDVGVLRYSTLPVPGFSDSN